jgi:hypothetical protein
MSTLTLRPPEGINLAEKAPCLRYAHHGDTNLAADCELCGGTGEVLLYGESPREHLSHSSIGLLNACPRKFDLHYGKRLSLIQTRRSLGLGRAFQKAIEHGDPEAGTKALQEEFESTPGMDGDRLMVEQSIVRGAARLYLAKWPAPEGEEREYAYRVRLRSPWTGAWSQTFDLLGYADGVEDMGDWLELTENKFVGRVDAPTVQRLPLDRQVTLSCYGLWRATGKEVRRVNYRYVKKPAIKQKQGESLTAFCERVEADYEERPEFYSPDIDPLFRTADDLLRVEAELWVWAEQVRHARQQQIYPRNTAACSDYGGCQFIPICTGDPDAMSLYHVRPQRDLDDEAKGKS